MSVTSWNAMDPPRRIALVTGVFFALTFVTSIAGLLLYGPVLNDATYIVGAGADMRVSLGALLEVLLVVANIGTAVTLFPILRRQNEGAALGYVTARLVESTFIIIGLLSLLAIVTLRQEPAGADANTLVTTGKSLVAVHDWTFLLGPGFIVGIGNGMLLGYLMYRSRLVPRRMAVIGMVGGAMLCASGIAVLFGLFDAGSAGQFIATIPEIVWEGFLAIYLTFWGFTASPIATEYQRRYELDHAFATPVIAAT